MGGVRELTSDERVSVARAVKLIRKANKDKADLLNDMQQQGNVIADQAMADTTYATTQKGKPGDPKSNKITLNPKKVLLDPNQPLPEDSPDIVTLAGTLLHEADHAQCHDEMACFGAEIDFYDAINHDFNKYFPGTLTPAQKTAIEDRKHAMRDEANGVYERIARKGGTGYGKDHKQVLVPISVAGSERNLDPHDNLKEAMMARVLPDVPATAVTLHLEEIALRIYTYFDSTHVFPPSGNKALVKTLREFDPKIFRRVELNNAAELIDPWGRPYIYQMPGKWFPQDFDLYSLGPCGRDEGGAGENILCELHRR